MEFIQQDSILVLFRKTIVVPNLTREKNNEKNRKHISTSKQKYKEFQIKTRIRYSIV